MTPANNRHETINDFLRNSGQSEDEHRDAAFGCPLPIRHVIGAACLLYMALGSVEALFAAGL